MIAARKTPEPDAHLVQRLGAAGAHRGLVDDDLAETIPGYGAEGIRSCDLGLDVEVAGLLDDEINIAEQLEAPFGLGLDGEPEGHRPGKRAREAE